MSGSPGNGGSVANGGSVPHRDLEPRRAPRNARESDSEAAPTGLLRSLLDHSRMTLSLAALLGLFGGVAGAGLIALINRVEQRGTGDFGSWAGWLFFALLAARLASGLISKMLLVRSGQDVVRHLRATLARRLLSAPLLCLEALGASRVTAALTTDVAAVALFFANIPTLCVNIAVVLGCLSYIGFVSRSLLALTLVVIALGIGVHQLLSRRATRRLGRARRTENALFRHLASLTDGFKELKMDGGKAEFVLTKLLDRAANEYRVENVGAYDAYALAEAWTGFLVFLPFGIVLFGGFPWLTTSAGETGAYVLTLLFLVAPLSSVVGLVPIIGSALVSIRSIEGVQQSLDAVDGEPSTTAPLLRAGAFRRLTFEGICFSYQDPDAFGVGPVDFALEPGEIVFIVGGNGSGKSTFVKVMAGLYPANRGRICVDGAPVREDQRQAYRASFSSIFADYHLFPELPVALDAEAELRAKEYLSLLRLDGRVTIENGRFSRVDLSTGQRKRLAMVAAMLENRPIMILDEWAAEQDAEARAFFYDHLLPTLRARGTTVVAVTHDDRFFACADRLVRFDYGRITEESRTRAPRSAPRGHSVPALRTDVSGV
jgi:putative ATP-binding cassette transporter